ncbi:Retrovirus-related Pol polyprotein from transposon 17.6, partial [Schistosoma japonicum]
CKAAFNKLKSIIGSRLLLTHYDPSMPIIVAADASASGLRCQKAIMHASRTLTPAERKYSQIEKEALALVFAVRRFHKFLYGRRFTLLTDHKPLLTIFGSKSGIPAHSANRLQRRALILLGYDFDIQYRHTQEFGQADALSRLISEHATVDDDTIIASLSKEDYAASYLTNAVRALPVSVSDIQIASRNDAMIRRAMKYVTQGWPRIAFEGDMKQLYQRRDSLCVVDDCLMFGERVVVPKSLQPRMLQQFHSGYPGMLREERLTRHRNQLRKRATADLEKTEQKPGNIRSRRQSLRQRRQTVKLQVLGMLDPQNSLGKPVIFVILLCKFEFPVFAPKIPFLTFSSCFPLGKTLNLIGSLTTIFPSTRRHAVVDNCLVFGNRVVITQFLRHKVLSYNPIRAVSRDDCSYSITTDTLSIYRGKEIR